MRNSGYRKLLNSSLFCGSAILHLYQKQDQDFEVTKYITVFKFKVARDKKKKKKCNPGKDTLK